jgi:hypothetical protein
MDQVEILKTTIGALVLQIVSLQAQVVALQAQKAPQEVTIVSS